MFRFVFIFIFVSVVYGECKVNQCVTDDDCSTCGYTDTEHYIFAEAKYACLGGASNESKFSQLLKFNKTGKCIVPQPSTTSVEYAKMRATCRAMHSAKCCDPSADHSTQMFQCAKHSCREPLNCTIGGQCLYDMNDESARGNTVRCCHSDEDCPPFDKPNYWNSRNVSLGTQLCVRPTCRLNTNSCSYEKAKDCCIQDSPDCDNYNHPLSKCNVGACVYDASIATALGFNPFTDSGYYDAVNSVDKLMKDVSSQVRASYKASIMPMTCQSRISMQCECTSDEDCVSLTSACSIAHCVSDEKYGARSYCKVERNANVPASADKKCCDGSGIEDSIISPEQLYEQCYDKNDPCRIPIACDSVPTTMHNQDNKLQGNSIPRGDLLFPTYECRYVRKTMVASCCANNNDCLELAKENTCVLSKCSDSKKCNLNPTGYELSGGKYRMPCCYTSQDCYADGGALATLLQNDLTSKTDGSCVTLKCTGDDADVDISMRHKCVPILNSVCPQLHQSVMSSSVTVKETIQSSLIFPQATLNECDAPLLFTFNVSIVPDKDNVHPIVYYPKKISVTMASNYVNGKNLPGKVWNASILAIVAKDSVNSNVFLGSARHEFIEDMNLDVFTETIQWTATFTPQSAAEKIVTAMNLQFILYVNSTLASLFPSYVQHFFGEDMSFVELTWKDETKTFFPVQEISYVKKMNELACVHSSLGASETLLDVYVRLVHPWYKRHRPVPKVESDMQRQVRLEIESWSDEKIISMLWELEIYQQRRKENYYTNMKSDIDAHIMQGLRKRSGGENCSTVVDTTAYTEIAGFPRDFPRVINFTTSGLWDLQQGIYCPFATDVVGFDIDMSFTEHPGNFFRFRGTGGFVTVAAASATHEMYIMINDNTRLLLPAGLNFGTQTACCDTFNSPFRHLLREGCQFGRYPNNTITGVGPCASSGKASVLTFVANWGEMYYVLVAGNSKDGPAPAPCPSGFSDPNTRVTLTDTFGSAPIPDNICSAPGLASIPQLLVGENNGCSFPNCTTGPGVFTWGTFLGRSCGKFTGGLENMLKFTANDTTNVGIVFKTFTAGGSGDYMVVVWETSLSCKALVPGSFDGDITPTPPPCKDQPTTAQFEPPGEVSCFTFPALPSAILVFPVQNGKTYLVSFTRENSGFGSPAGTFLYDFIVDQDLQLPPENRECNSSDIRHCDGFGANCFSLVQGHCQGGASNIHICLPPNVTTLAALPTSIQRRQDWPMAPIFDIRNFCYSDDCNAFASSTTPCTCRCGCQTVQSVDNISPLKTWFTNCVGGPLLNFSFPFPTTAPPTPQPPTPRPTRTHSPTPMTPAPTPRGQLNESGCGIPPPLCIGVGECFNYTATCEVPSIFSNIIAQFNLTNTTKYCFGGCQFLEIVECNFTSDCERFNCCGCESPYGVIECQEKPQVITTGPTPFPTPFPTNFPTVSPTKSPTPSPTPPTPSPTFVPGTTDATMNMCAKGSKPWQGPINASLNYTDLLFDSYVDHMRLPGDCIGCAFDFVDQACTTKCLSLGGTHFSFVVNISMENRETEKLKGLPEGGQPQNVDFSDTNNVYFVGERPGARDGIVLLVNVTGCNRDYYQSENLHICTSIHAVPGSFVVTPLSNVDKVEPHESTYETRGGGRAFSVIRGISLPANTSFHFQARIEGCTEISGTEPDVPACFNVTVQYMSGRCQQFIYDWLHCKPHNKDKYGSGPYPYDYRKCMHHDQYWVSQDGTAMGQSDPCEACGVQVQNIFPVSDVLYTERLRIHSAELLVPQGIYASSNYTESGAVVNVRDEIFEMPYAEIMTCGIDLVNNDVTLRPAIASDFLCALDEDNVRLSLVDRCEDAASRLQVLRYAVDVHHANGKSGDRISGTLKIEIEREPLFILDAISATGEINPDHVCHNFAAQYQLAATAVVDEDLIIENSKVTEVFLEPNRAGATIEYSDIAPNGKLTVYVYIMLCDSADRYLEVTRINVTAQIFDKSEGSNGANVDCTSRLLHEIRCKNVTTLTNNATLASSQGSFTCADLAIGNTDDKTKPTAYKDKVVRDVNITGFVIVMIVICLVCIICLIGGVAIYEYNKEKRRKEKL